MLQRRERPFEERVTRKEAQVAVLKEGSLNHQSATQAAHRDKSDGLMFGSVGDEIFVVGAPYGISNTLTAGHVSAPGAL